MTEVLIIFLIYKDKKDKGIWKKNCVQVERLDNTGESFIAREFIPEGKEGWDPKQNRLHLGAQGCRGYLLPLSSQVGL